MHVVLLLLQIGKEHPEYLVAHAYTRYLGDLSGGQVLGRITQKSLGLKNGDGLQFFSFPNVNSPNLFKQLYRSRMNSIELADTQKQEVLKEAITAFEFNIQVFDELQNLLNISDKNELREQHNKQISKTPGTTQKYYSNAVSAFIIITLMLNVSCFLFLLDVRVTQTSALPSSLLSGSQILRMLLGVCLAVAVSMYAF